MSAHCINAVFDIVLHGLTWNLPMTKEGRHRCAACRKIIGEGDTPLLLWKDDGVSMMALHWACAEPRFVMPSIVTLAE